MSKRVMKEEKKFYFVEKGKKSIQEKREGQEGFYMVFFSKDCCPSFLPNPREDSREEKILLAQFFLKVEGFQLEIYP